MKLPDDVLEAIASGRAVTFYLDTGESEPGNGPLVQNDEYERPKSSPWERVVDMLLGTRK